MDVLLIATGFTGALTLVWLARLVLTRFGGQAGAAVHFGEACADAVLREVGSARGEVLLAAGTLTCRAVAQALIDARLRGVQVEVILGPEGEADPGSDLHFLAEQGLPPFVREEVGGPDYLLVDGRTVVQLPADLGRTPTAGCALIVRGQADLVHVFRQDFTARRAQAQPVQGTSPLAQPLTPEEAPAEDLLTAVARCVTTPEQHAEEDEEAPASGPVVTTATAELFARLRQEAADAEQEENDPPQTEGKAA